MHILDRMIAVILLVLIAAVLITSGAIAAGVIEEAPASTDRHVVVQHPDEVNDDRGAAALVDLVSRDLDEDQRERVEELFGQETLDEIIAADGEVDREMAAARVELAETRESFSTELRQFNRTLRAYEWALAHQDNDAALAYATELDVHAHELERLGEDLIDGYESMGQPYIDDPTASVESVQSDLAFVQTEHDRVVRTEFDEPRLHLLNLDTHISHTQPFYASGELRTGANEPIHGNVSVTIGDQRVEGALGPHDEFELTLQPASAAAGTETAVIRFEPEPGTPYRSTETVVPIQLDPVDPDIRVQVSEREVGYAESLHVHGRVTVEGEPVSDIPLEITVDGEQVADTRTHENGTFEAAAVLGATDPGSATVGVDIAHDDLAIRPSQSTTPIMIRETQTDISVTVLGGNDDQLIIAGELSTVSGQPIENRSLTLELGQDIIHNVTTDAEGTFTANVERPKVDEATELPLEISFDGDRNLRPSQASLTVAIGEDPGVVVQSIDGLAGKSGFVGLGSAILMIGVWVLVPSLARTETRQVAFDESPQGHKQDHADNGHASLRSLDPARRLLDENPTDAVRLGFGLLRMHLDGNGDGAVTHWEFYQDATNRDPEHIEALLQLTGAYERAVFSPDEIDQREADQAISGVEPLLE